MPKNYCIMQIWAESGKSALPICNYSQILYQFLTFTQNLKRSLLLLRSLFHFERPVYGTFDNRQVFFRAKLQLMADPLPLCAFFPHDLRVKISLYGKSADLNQLDHHRQARNCTLILNVGKIPPFNPNHFCQCFSCQTLCLSCGFDIRTEGFKTGTIFNFRHITSPGYIV